MQRQQEGNSLKYRGQFHKIRYAAKRQLLLSPKPDSHKLFVGNRILKKSNDPKASTFVQLHKTENPASGKQQLALSGVPDLMELAADETPRSVSLLCRSTIPSARHRLRKLSRDSIYQSGSIESMHHPMVECHQARLVARTSIVADIQRNHML